MNCDWKKTKLSDVIEMNPRLTLKKGTLAKKISMQALAEFNKKIQSYEITPFTSGTKFQNGDTLLARITPCLENGKTAFVDILEEGEIAFGSTEFIVLRAKSGLTDEKFIYYLSISPGFRNIAIKSMTGSSGRQRVQSDVLANTVLNLPPLKEQKRIANILSILDEKIDHNNTTIKMLDEIAQTIFINWFIDFQFPDEEGLPYKSNGGKLVDCEIGMRPIHWRVEGLGSLISISSGKRPRAKQSDKNNEYIYPLIGASSTMGYVNEYLYNEKILVIGRVGTHGVIQRLTDKCWPSDNTLVIKSNYYNFVFQVLKLINYQSLNRGSTQPLITQTDIKNYKILIPDEKILHSYEDTINPMFELINNLEIENNQLREVKETILPKLISGDFLVSDFEKEVEECLQKSN